MKYVRTKDCRIVVQGEPSDKGFEQGRLEIHNFGNVETLAPFSNDDILGESNSIEELADYLLFKFKAEKKMIGIEIEETAHLSILKSFMEDGSLDFARLFIFKGKDLKCVSEMNETGKWELL